VGESAAIFELKAGSKSGGSGDCENGFVAEGERGRGRFV
jgi:hypothetical protein